MELKAFLKLIRQMIQKSNYFIFTDTVNRKFLISSFIIGFVAVIYTIFWLSAAIYLENIIEDWKNHQTYKGADLSYSKMEISGFPINFRIRLNNPQLQIPFGTINYQKLVRKKKLIWQGKRVLVSLRPWNFNSIKLDLSGLNRVIFKNKDFIYDFVIETKLINIETKIFLHTWPGEFRIKVKGMKILEKIKKIDISIEEALFSTAVLLNEGAEDSSLEKNQNQVYKMKLKGIHLPKKLRWPIDNYIEKILMELKVFKKLGPIVSLQNLTEWRDAGGIIDINSFEGIFGGLKTRAKGTLALDQNFQPLLAMSAKFEGLISFIDRLNKLGFIGSNTTILAKVILGGISKRAENGMLSVNLPLSIQNRQLAVGPVTLMTLPTIDWNDGFN
jgi:hypothetical protein